MHHDLPRDGATSGGISVRMPRQCRDIIRRQRLSAQTMQTMQTVYDLGIAHGRAPPSATTRVVMQSASTSRRRWSCMVSAE